MLEHVLTQWGKGPCDQTSTFSTEKKPTQVALKLGNLKSNCKTSCSRGCDPRSSLPPTELCTLRNTVLGRAAALKKSLSDYFKD